jgi:hypothetical protein
MAATDEPQFGARQRSDDLLVKAQGVRLVDVAAGSHRFSGLDDTAVFNLVHGALL